MTRALYRYELKYFVAASQRDKFLELTNFALIPDTHGADGLYRVTSQYYDTPDLEAYWEKIDGVNKRQKYRLRFYGPELQTPFFEIKHRHNRVISKERVPLQLEGAQALLEKRIGLDKIGDCALLETEENAELVERLGFLGGHLDLQAKALISYQRWAYIGADDPGIRVTFDHNCMAYSAEEYLRTDSNQGDFLEQGNPIVLELKFNEVAPVWLVETARAIEARPVRFSKYAKGLVQLSEELLGTG